MSASPVVCSAHAQDGRYPQPPASQRCSCIACVDASARPAIDVSLHTVEGGGRSRPAAARRERTAGRCSSERSLSFWSEVNSAADTLRSSSSCSSSSVRYASMSAAHPAKALGGHCVTAKEGSSAVMSNTSMLI
eukprot:3933934-Rhodomonas_salina.3